MKERTQYTIIVAVIILLGVGVAFFQPRQTKAPTHNQNSTSNANTNSTPTTNTPKNTNTVVAGTTRFFTDDLPDADPYYRFSALIPSAWVGTYNDADRSIEFFDPKASTGANRAVTILAQYYIGKDFSAAPSGVKATTMTVDSQPARSYSLTADAAMVQRIPTWKVGQTYQRVDVLGQKVVNNTYYTFSKGPGVTDSVFSTFLNSLDVKDILQPQ